MLPSTMLKKWGVKVYQHKCDSVNYYVDIKQSQVHKSLEN